MSPSGLALRASPPVANGPPQQGTAHDLGGIRELLREPVAGFQDLIAFHSSK
jgi:hypothetical protein